MVPAIRVIRLPMNSQTLPLRVTFILFVDVENVTIPLNVFFSLRLGRELLLHMWEKMFLKSLYE